MTIWAPVVRRHRRLQALGLFVRLSALGLTVALPLVGAATVSPALPAGAAAGVVAVALGFHLFAYLLNDVVDLPIDRHEPRRAVSPLVQGTVSPGVALAVGGGGAVVALGVAVGWGAGGRRGPAALVLALGLMAAYDLWGKRSPVPWLLDLVQGLGWGALFLYGAAIRGPWTALTGWLFAFWTVFIVLANGVHGGLRDLANDARCGARSTAVAMGAQAGGDGRVVVPRRMVAYAWALHGALVGLVVGAWASGGPPPTGWARAVSLAVALGLGAAGGWALARAVDAGGEPHALRLAGTLHLLLLMAMPVALLLPGLDPGFRALVVVGFAAPLAALGWLPDLVRWVRAAWR